MGVAASAWSDIGTTVAYSECLLEAASGPVLTQRLQVSGGKRLPAPLHGCEMWDFLARWR